MNIHSIFKTSLYLHHVINIEKALSIKLVFEIKIKPCFQMNTFLLFMNYYIDSNHFFPPTEVSIPFVHMTNKYSILVQIIREGFRPNYCTETISNNDREIISAFPMISVSNLSSDKAMIDLDSYGTFGIVLNKKFIEKHKFNPVLYLDRSSDITSYIVNSFDVIKSKYDDSRLSNAIFQDQSNEQNVLFARNLITQFAYSKNYDAPLYRKNSILVNNYSFGLEREWRIVHKDPTVKFFLKKNDLREKHKYNDLIKDVRYAIEVDEINEIIIETEEEKEDIKIVLKDKYGMYSNIKFTINTRRHIDDE